MTYIVCRMDHPSGQVAQLDSFGTEDAAKMCLANVVEEALAERDYLKSEDVRELLDRAVRELRLELCDARSERESYFYIDRE